MSAYIKCIACTLYLNISDRLDIVSDERIFTIPFSLNLAAQINYSWMHDIREYDVRDLSTKFHETHEKFIIIHELRFISTTYHEF